MRLPSTHSGFLSGVHSPSRERDTGKDSSQDRAHATSPAGCAQTPSRVWEDEPSKKVLTGQHRAFLTQKGLAGRMVWKLLPSRKPVSQNRVRPAVHSPSVPGLGRQSCTGGAGPLRPDHRGPSPFPGPLKAARSPGS